MIQIPPGLPDPPIPRRTEGINVQAVPAVLADKPGVDPGVVLRLPTPVLETPVDGMRAKDATVQPGATQIDNDMVTPAARLALAPDVEVAVRQGLNTAELPDRLAKLLVQLEKFSDKTGAPVLWPAGEQVKAARPEDALFNLRQALGGSMLFEVQRLQTRFVPSASSAEQGGDEAGAALGGGQSAILAASASEGAGELVPAALANGVALPDFPDAEPRPDGVAAKGMPNPVPVAENTSSNGMPGPRGAATVRRDGVSSNVAGEAPAADALAKSTGEASVPADAVGQNELTRRAEPLSADSPSIRDAVRLLLHGELRWQGELSPGVFARLEREDVWEEDSHSPGALVKGTLVSVDVDLPTLGRVRVRGMFIKDSVRVTVLPDESARNTFQTEFQALRDRLAGRGLEAAQVRLLEKDNG